MKVELSERARQTVEQLVERGEFASNEVAVEAAIALLEGPDRELSAQELADLLAPAFADIEAGRVIPAADVLREARSLLDAKIQSNSL